jgi:DNA processing protein
MLVTSADDILQQLDIETTRARTQTRIQMPETQAERILLALVGAEPRHIDDLCHESGLSIQDTSGTLLAMELKGFVRQTGSQHYVRA